MSRAFISVQKAAKSSLSAQKLLFRGIHSTRPCREQFFNANKTTFQKVALNDQNSDKVVLVDFYADWCQPCKMISPILEKLTSDPSLKSGSGRSLHLVTVNTDEEYDVAMEYQVRSLPTVMAFRDGKAVDHFIGALKEADVRKFIERV